MMLETVFMSRRLINRKSTLILTKKKKKKNVLEKTQRARTDAEKDRVLVMLITY